MSNEMTIESLLGDIDGGVFEAKALMALKEAAMRVVETGKKGKVTIELSFSRISESSQVSVGAKLKADTPKSKGRIIEEDEVDTPMYVGVKGNLSAFPQHQVDVEELLSKQGA